MINQKQNHYEINNIIKDIKNNNFKNALEKTKLISKNFPDKYTISKLFSSIYLNLKDYENAIKYYEKLLNYKKENYKIYNNIGTSLFQLGKINRCIHAFKNSIANKPNLGAYFNLGIAYEEIGDYKNSLINFVKVIKLDPNNYKAKKSLINILTYYHDESINDNEILKINFQIKKIYNNYKSDDLYNIKNIKSILSESNKIINNFQQNFYIDETQIILQNSKNLNCNRHFKVFNEFNIIPKYCFSCYKIQVSLFNVIDLIKLYFVFKNINLKNNNIRKCMVETRLSIKVNYKGFIYCKGLEEAQTIMNEINLVLNNKNISKFQIEIKHGCSEFYKSYPKYKKINFHGKQEFEYDNQWIEKENIIDKKIPAREKQDEKFFGETLKELNLYDILIIKNWIVYAKKIEDKYSDTILEDELSFPIFEKIIEKQIDFRKKELQSD